MATAAYSLVESDGTKWNTKVPAIEPIKDKVLPLINSTAEKSESQYRLAETD